MIKSGKKILVVDDDETMRELLSDYLEMSGYDVDSAENGEVAFQTVLKQDNPSYYSLVITDINMPILGGIGLQKKIQESFPDLPVVFMTGYGVEKVRIELEGYAHGFLGKPFELDELTSLLDGILK